MRIILIGLLSLALLPAIGQEKNSASQIPLFARIQELIEKPDKYHNKLVSARGYLNLGFEQTILYESENDLKYHRYENSLWVSFDNRTVKILDRHGDTLSYPGENLNNGCVEISGIFDKESKGHLSLNRGTIQHLETIRILQSEAEHGPNFFLYVSNASIELTPVDISVRIDGRPAIQDTFDVKGKRTIQHNWINYEYVLSRGKHMISAETRKGAASIAKDFELDSLKFLVIDYYYPPPSNMKGNRKSGEFVITMSNHPIGFE